MAMPISLADQVVRSLCKKKLRNLLENVLNLAMHQQKENLQTAFNEWKGNHEQVDDVCIIGVRI